MTDPADPTPVPPDLALQRLREGNQRFIWGTSSVVSQGWRPGLASGQAPMAVILGCSDSRAPAELVFDQGLGDLFVIRVAGNVVAPSGIGSVEFAAAQFGTRLVVVMGHTQCGAVGATVRAIEAGNAPESKNLRAITDRIRPHIEGIISGTAVPSSPAVMDRQALLRKAIRANILASVAQLRYGSPLLEQLVASGQLLVVGAEYVLETGQVDFFEVPHP